jgi:hypothetical protein
MVEENNKMMHGPLDFGVRLKEILLAALPFALFNKSISIRFSQHTLDVSHRYTSEDGRIKSQDEWN